MQRSSTVQVGVCAEFKVGGVCSGWGREEVQRCTVQGWGRVQPLCAGVGVHVYQKLAKLLRPEGGETPSP